MRTPEQLEAENRTLKVYASNLEKEKKSLLENQAELESKLKWYEEQLKLNKKKLYGASSEKTDSDCEQLNLFNEAEAEREAISVEPTIETITYKRKKSKGHREKLLAELPAETIEYTLPQAEQDCPACGEPLHVMSKEIRKELKIIPAQIKVVEHVSYIYACRNCEKNEAETPIITAAAPKALITKSLVSPSLMAHIMNQKFTNAVPLYRQEQELKRMNVSLSRQTLANWVIKGSSLLEPLYNKMHEILLQKEVLHADETTLEVLCEPDRPAQTTSYMWLYRTSGCDDPIVLYDYQEGRSGSFAEKFLQGFHGYLHTDGWGGYHRLEPNITLCGCWAHARRKFDEALSILPQKDRTSTAGIGLSYINKLFALEQSCENKSFNDRYEVRQKQSKPVIEAFFSWANEEYGKITLPKSTLGTALKYALNQKKYLTAFLDDGRIELSNNCAERAIKPFVIGRKNWLFCNTPSGAKSSAIIYSLIETAKENGLKPYEYLNFLFEKVQQSEAGNWEKLLPWYADIPDYIKIKTI